MATDTSTMSDMAKVKLIESGKRLGQMFAKLRKEYLSIDEMREIITTISAQPEITSRWNRELMFIERNGILAGLEYDERFLELEHRGYNPDAKYDRQALEREFRHLHPFWEGRQGDRYLPSYMGVTREYADEWIDSDNNFEPFLVPIIRDEFKATVGTQWTIRINDLDPLTQVGAMINVDNPDAADQWASVSDKVWTSWAYTQGNNAVIKGAVKKGKTNFALLLTEKFMAEGWFIVSNIYVKDAPGNYKYCPDLSTMLTAICEARLKNLNVLIIFDEAGLFWAKQDASTRIAKDLSKLLLTYGKMHANVCLISHWSSDIPSSVVRTIVAEFEKLSHKTVYAEIRDGIGLRARSITSVPPTSLSYNPDQVQSFEVNMSCGELFSFASRIPEGVDQWKAILEYVPSHVITAKEEYIDNKQLAKALRAKGMGVREIARQLHESKTSVSRWTAEEKAIESIERKPLKETGQDGTA